MSSVSPTLQSIIDRVDSEFSQAHQFQNINEMMLRATWHLASITYKFNRLTNETQRLEKVLSNLEFPDPLLTDTCSDPYRFEALPMPNDNDDPNIIFIPCTCGHYYPMGNICMRGSRKISKDDVIMSWREPDYEMLSNTSTYYWSYHNVNTSFQYRIIQIVDKEIEFVELGELYNIIKFNGDRMNQILGLP